MDQCSDSVWQFLCSSESCWPRWELNTCLNTPLQSQPLLCLSLPSCLELCTEESSFLLNAWVSLTTSFFLVCLNGKILIYSMRFHFKKINASCPEVKLCSVSQWCHRVGGFHQCVWKGHVHEWLGEHSRKPFSFMAGFASKHAARVPGGIHPVAHGPLKWLGSALTGWFPLSRPLQRGPGNMPVMWDSYISGLDQVDSFSSISTKPLPTVVNEQSQLKAGNCSAPFLWEDVGWWQLCLGPAANPLLWDFTAPSLLWHFIHAEGLAGAGFGLASSPRSKQESWVQNFGAQSPLVDSGVSPPKMPCFQGLYFAN